MIRKSAYNGLCNTVIYITLYIVSKNISFPKSITVRQQFLLNPGANVNITRMGRYILVSMTTAQTVSLSPPPLVHNPYPVAQSPYARVYVCQVYNICIYIECLFVRLFSSNQTCRAKNKKTFFLYKKKQKCTRLSVLIVLMNG